MSTQGYGNKPRRRIWVQHVAVEADRLQLQLDAARQTALEPREEVIADGIGELIESARRAAYRVDPVPRRWTNWWRGTLVEAAYLNLHSARAQIVDLYDEYELRAEIPPAVARAQQTLHRDDPRRTSAVQLLSAEPFQADLARPVLRRLIGDSYEKSDLEHAQLRSFRNIVLLAAVAMLALVVATVIVVANQPSWMPLCFTADGGGQVCATGTGRGPRPSDIVMVSLLGALGGMLSSAVSIRNLKGTSTPYDVPVALAMLKVPLGAFTAFLALVAIRGGFVPGLSSLDSQEQILAYALVFGFAQQALSRLLDRRAQTLMEGLPGGTAVEPTPAPPANPMTPPPVDDSSLLLPDPSEDGDDEPLSDDELLPGDANAPADQQGPDGTEVVGDVPVVGDPDVPVVGDPEVPEVGDPEVVGEADESEEAALDADATDDGDDGLPDPEAEEYVEDDLAERPAGPDAPDGVDYPSDEDELEAKN